MDNEDVVYKYNGILLNHKKKEILSFATTCGHRRHYNKWSKSNRERQILMILYMESKKDNKVVNKQKSSRHRYREQSSGYHWGEQ